MKKARCWPRKRVKSYAKARSSPTFLGEKPLLSALTQHPMGAFSGCETLRRRLDMPRTCSRELLSEPGRGLQSQSATRE